MDGCVGKGLDPMESVRWTQETGGEGRRGGGRGGMSVPPALIALALADSIAFALLMLVEHTV